MAIFTNLTQDHLDYHGTMEKYLASKARLFDGVGTAPPRVAVINADDPAAEAIARAASHSQCMMFSAEGRGEFRTEQVRMQGCLLYTSRCV